MSPAALRVIAGILVFLAVVLGGILIAEAVARSTGTAGWFERPAPDASAVLLGVAILAGLLATLGLEIRQTGRLASLAGQFTTRTFVLIPVAIAINAALGATLATHLRVPLYLDSMGTILVGVLCGPAAGALTGGLSNVLRSYLIPPPFWDQYAAAFTVVSVVIGMLAGAFARLGWFRPRPSRSTRELVLAAAASLAVLGTLAWYGYTRFYSAQIELLPADGDPILLGLAVLVLAAIILAVVGYLHHLFARRDAAVAWVVVAGVIIGSVAALIASPIAAHVFGGVTGSGVDLIVAAFRQAGADVMAATLQQSLLVDPIDKMLSALLVYLVITSLAARTLASFPQGDRLVPRPPADEPSPGRAGAAA